jgi:hypothetical protein
MSQANNAIISTIPFTKIVKLNGEATVSSGKQGRKEPMENFNQRMLNEIINLRKTAEIVGMNQRISNQLEILRYVRNNALGLSFDEGFREENMWWKQNS